MQRFTVLTFSILKILQFPLTENTEIDWERERERESIKNKNKFLISVASGRELKHWRGVYMRNGFQIALITGCIHCGILPVLKLTYIPEMSKCVQWPLFEHIPAKYSQTFIQRLEWLQLLFETNWRFVWCCGRIILVRHMIGIVSHNTSVESGWVLIKQILSSRWADVFEK